MQKELSSKAFSPVRRSHRCGIHMPGLVKDHVSYNLLKRLHHDEPIGEPFGIIQNDFLRITGFREGLSFDLKNLFEILNRERSDGAGRRASHVLTVLSSQV